MNQDSQLPPLPPSDPGSLKRNHTDPFYGLTVKEFWGDNQVSQHQVEDFKKCKHYFEYDQSVVGVICRYCHVGYIGQFEIRDGNLVFDGQPYEFSTL